MKIKNIYYLSQAKQARKEREELLKARRRMAELEAEITNSTAQKAEMAELAIHVQAMAAHGVRACHP